MLEFQELLRLHHRCWKFWSCWTVSGLAMNPYFSRVHFCHYLETLIIDGCRDVSEESIKSLSPACCHSFRSSRMDCVSLICVLSTCRHLVALDMGWLWHSDRFGFTVTGNGCFWVPTDSFKDEQLHEDHNFRCRLDIEILQISGLPWAAIMPAYHKVGLPGSWIAVKQTMMVA